MTINSITLTIALFFLGMASTSKAETTVFEHLTGAWKGTSWTIDRAGNRVELSGRECVYTWKHLRSYIIEGIRLNNSHAAVWDSYMIVKQEENGTFVGSAHLMDQQIGTYDVAADSAGFTWQAIDAGQITRYAVTLSGDTLKQVSEVSADNGQTWSFSFEMTLTRSDDPCDPI